MLTFFPNDRSPKQIPMHEWSSIYAARTGREGILKVADQPYAMGMSLGAFTQLSLPLNLYIGGVPNLRDIHQNVQSPEMFGGCIQKAVINGRQLSLVRDVLSGLNIENCQHACSEKPCRNSGTCEPAKSHYQCHCVNNYIGTHCEQGIQLRTISLAYQEHSLMRFSFLPFFLSLQELGPLRCTPCSTVTVFSSTLTLK